MQARERLWLTADKQRLVGEGHRDAATLYAAIGDEVPQEAADRFGLVDGCIGAQEKRGGTGEDKSRKGGEDKSREGDGDKIDADDLTRIKGIGAKTAKALGAAGIDSFAALATLDPAAPPEVAGVSPHADWAGWIATAREALAAAGEDHRNAEEGMGA